MKQPINNLKNKIQQMIKQAVVSAVLNDDSGYPQMQITYNSKASSVVRLSPYGLCTQVPNSSSVLLFSSQAQESTKFGIPFSALNRLKDLKEGECALYNEVTGVCVKINSAGGVEINGPTTITGAVNITGDLTVTGTIEGGTVTDGSIDLGTHKHTGVTSGGSNTGGPV